MAITDRKFHVGARAPRKHIVAPLITATSQTVRPFYVHKPGYDFQVRGLSAYALTEAGAVTVDGAVCPDDAVLLAGALTVHSTPEQLALALSRYLVGGKVVEKAAATAITFSAAHKITALKWGVILIQTDNAGAISSKVPSSTQAYENALLAAAALPAADAGKLGIARLLILANAQDWDANTDDLTQGSDLTTLTITMVAAVARIIGSTGIAAASGLAVAGTLNTALAALRGSRNENLVLFYTSDSSGALTNGQVTVDIGPLVQGEQLL